MATTRKGTRSARPDGVTQRLVELTFSDAATVAAWARHIGYEVSHEHGSGVVTMRNPWLPMTTAFLETADPVTRAVTLGFITAGAFWPHAYPDLLKHVNAEWTARKKAEIAAVDAAKAQREGNPGG